MCNGRVALLQPKVFSAQSESEHFSTRREHGGARRGASKGGPKIVHDGAAATNIMNGRHAADVLLIQPELFCCSFRFFR